MADTSGDERGDVLRGEGRAQLRAAAQKHVHHLGDAEAVAEVVEGIRAVAGFHRALEKRKR